ncbi:MAG: peptidylprolyl isomerase, partial [bacterium]
KRTRGLVCFLLLLIWGWGILHSRSLFAQEVLDSICAIVDREIILESEVAYAVSVYLIEQDIRTRPEPSIYNQIRDQILNSFIARKILYVKAQEDTLKVEDRSVAKEVEKRFQTLINQAGSEKKLEEFFGRPIPLIKRELSRIVREEMLVDMVRAKIVGKVTLTSQEIEEFFEKYRDALPNVPERVELSHILWKLEPSPEVIQQAKEKISRIWELLKEGADFDSIASLYSDDPSASRGGRLGFTRRGDLLPELEEAAYALEPGMISDIIRTQFGFHIIKLIERQGERISTQHILIALTPSEQDKERVLSHANEVRKGLMSISREESSSRDEAFVLTAVRESQDEGSRAKKGKLGIFKVGELPEEFKNAILGLTEGDITEPFISQFGVHLVKIDRRYPMHKPTLNEDYSLIEGYALNAKREEIIKNWILEHKDDHYIYPPRIWE